MRRPIRPLLAAGVVLMGVAVLAGAWAVGASGPGDDAAPVAARPAPLPATNLAPPATGSLGGQPVAVRVVGRREASSGAAAGTAATIIVTTRAAVTGVTVQGPGGGAIPPMTGALLIARSRGEIDAPTSTTHGHGHTTGARLGAALGATGVFAAKMSPGATDVAVDAQGTRLAAVHADAGTLERLDLVRGTRPVETPGLGRPTQVWFAPDGDRVWVNDADAGVRVVGRTGGDAPVVAGAAGANTVAFAPERGIAVVAGENTTEASLVDTATLARTATLDLPAPVTSATFIRRPAAVLLTHPDGSVSVAPLDRSQRPYRIATGIAGGARTTAVVTRDGRRAAVLLPDARRITVLDLRSRRPLTSITTGAEPRGLELLRGRYATTRSTRDPTATWVDVRTPSRAADLPLGDRPATSMALTDKGTRLLFTDPAARQVLDVHAMMGRPMVMGVIPGAFAPDDVAPFPGGVHRTGPREFRRTVVLRDDGDHRITIHSPGGAFTTTLRGGSVTRPLTATLTSPPPSVAVGDRATIGFRLSRATTAPVELVAITTGPAGTRQTRVRATRSAGGWSAALTPSVVGSHIIVPIVDGTRVEWAGDTAVAVRVLAR